MLIGNIILALKGIAVNWKRIVLVYAIFPIVLVICLGHAFKDIYSPQTNIGKINITIVDHDNTKSSKEFIAIFKTKSMKKICNITKNGECIIKIPKGYENKLAKLKEVKIEVSGKDSMSQDDEDTVKNIISDYGKLAAQNMVISNKTTSLSPKDRHKIYDALNNIYSEKIFRNNIIKPKKTLNSYENLGCTLIDYMIMTIIISIAGSYKKEKKDGIYKRLMAMPAKKEKLFNTNLVCYFMQIIIYGAAYILGFVVTGLAFRKSNFINLTAVLICQSLLITSLSAFIIAFFSDKFSIPFLTIFLSFQTFFGDTFVPIAASTSDIYVKIAKFNPLSIVSDAYKNCIISNSFSSIEKKLLYMVAFSVIIYIIALFKIKIRWETN